MNTKLFLKQYIKMAMQTVFLPMVYRMHCRQNADPQLVIFADAHHSARPENMNFLYDALFSGQYGKYRIREMYLDYASASAGAIFHHMMEFMKCYAQAGTVVICDNFLPVAGCRKRGETMVVQLWHACGCLKKFGYDTAGDIPANYRGNVFRNTDLVTVSARECRAPFASAMRLPESCVQAAGVSRTDRYFDPEWAECASSRFYRRMPEAAGKKIVLWAPTFRGNPGDPRLVMPDLEALSRKLGEQTLVLVRLHPHMKKTLQELKKFNAAGSSAGIVFAPDDLETEDLFAVTDVLIADYSSLIFEYLAVGRELVLYAPDLDDYTKERGFYFDYRDIPGIHASSQKDLEQALQKALAGSTDENERKRQRREFLDKYMGACDGQATRRIAEIIAAHVRKLRTEGNTPG